MDTYHSYLTRLVPHGDDFLSCWYRMETISYRVGTTWRRYLTLLVPHGDGNQVGSDTIPFPLLRQSSGWQTSRWTGLCVMWRSHLTVDTCCQLEVSRYENTWSLSNLPYNLLPISLSSFTHCCPLAPPHTHTNTHIHAHRWWEGVCVGHVHARLYSLLHRWGVCAGYHGNSLTRCKVHRVWVGQWRGERIWWAVSPQWEPQTTKGSDESYNSCGPLLL